MLKKRVCVTLLINGGVLFRTKKFVPDYGYTINFVGNAAVDEVFLIDITRDGPSQASRETMKAFADACFTPITMGGWVRSLADVHHFMNLGADKVVVGAAALENPALIGEIARKYGSQAVTVACDALAVPKPGEGGSQGVVLVGKTLEKTSWSPARWASKAQSAGAGEIFVQSIDRDGSLGGYDLELLAEVVQNVNIPVVIGGGCGTWRHMLQAFSLGADGAATSNIFHLTETALTGFKAALGQAGVPVRA